MKETQDLLVATRNVHKSAEIAAMLGECFRVRDLSAVPEAPEVEETGTTFAENARLKALGISAVVPGLVLADDSGLEVDALEGAPGVYSARYAGTAGDDGANNARLMREMHGVENRAARFRCVMVLSRGDEVLGQFDGSVEGRIVDTARGGGGFGYDPFFVPDGHHQTFAELGAEVKNTLSHRARALEKFLQWLTSQE